MLVFALLMTSKSFAGPTTAVRAVRIDPTATITAETNDITINDVAARLAALSEALLVESNFSHHQVAISADQIYALSSEIESLLTVVAMLQTRVNYQQEQLDAITPKKFKRAQRRAARRNDSK